MDAIRSSRKRNQPCSPRPHPLFGTLTRSRSQLFLHQNRSGRRRSDRGRRQEPYSGVRRFQSPPTDGGICDTRQDGDDMVLVKDLCKKTKLNREASSCDDDEPSRVLIKDLRARRVYSPQSSAVACSDLTRNVFPKENGVDSGCRDPSVENSGCEKEGSKMKGFSCEDQSKDEINSVLSLILNEYRSDKDSDIYVDDVESASIEATESPDAGLSRKAQNFDNGNTETSNESRKLQNHKPSDGRSDQSNGKNGGNCSEKIDDSNEELVLTTPPDAVICGDSKVNEDEGKQVEGVEVKDAHAGAGFCPKDNQRYGSVPMSKSVLRPRLQGKLFQAPGSVSYRKLFPFLMNIMGDDSGTPKLDHCQKDEKGMDGQGFQLPLSLQSQEASKHELKSDSCAMHDASESGASAVDAVLAPANELSYGSGSKLTSSHYLPESPIQLDVKEVASECLFVPSRNRKCLSKTMGDPAADFHCVKNFENALHNDDFKQDSKHTNGVGNDVKANNCCCTSEQCGVLSEECVLTTPPDAELCGNSEISVGQAESICQDGYQVKAMDFTRYTQENAGETAKRKYSALKSKSVPRPHLHRKLFKTPGSVSYRRLLPFLMDFTKDDSVTPKLGHHQKDEMDKHAKRFQLPLSSQNQEASADEQKTYSGPMHGTVESNAFMNNILVDPANELSLGKQPNLTSSQDLAQLPMQVDAKEVVHECLSAPSINEHIEKVEIGSKDKCLSDSKVDPCSVMADFHCVKNVSNALHSDVFKQVLYKKSRQHNSESSSKAQNLLDINPNNVSGLTFEHHSNKEKELSFDSDERKQLHYPPEDQSLNHMDPNILDAEDNETSSHANSRSDDAVVLSHVGVSNEPRPPSDKVFLEKSDMVEHGGYKVACVPKGVVYGPKMPSKGIINKSATCVQEVRNGSESKTTMVLNHCSRIKLLKHAGSFNYKRLLPFLLNSTKDQFLIQKCLDQTPLPSISDSDSLVTPISDSNGCLFPMEDCRGNSGTQQQTGLLACDDSLNNDSTSPRSFAQIPEFQSSHDSCKGIQLQDEQVVESGHGKLERSPDTSISVHRIDLPIIPLGPIINEVTTREEEAKSALPQSSVYSEVKGNSSFLISSIEKPPETDGCCQNLSQMKALEQLRAPAVDFKKGILKRNPRGCRGLCTCLNCVSFRLHAERAFEFSRNQLLDAEEVALDLMKELSHLRNLLERCNSVNGNPVFDGNQVKEACRKAFATEQLAKDRLSQMNDDLNIHCRTSSLQRPRVRFADHVEEKVIQPGR